MSGAQGESTVEQTDVGSYFVANYPPFSVWTKEAVAGDARTALDGSPADVPLGLYLHIPFCRKRCHFCYFRVYTDKNAREVEQYLDLVAREWDLYARTPAVAGRRFNFVYFGGGTPSFLSTRQLDGLVKRLNAVSSWQDAEVVVDRNLVSSRRPDDLPAFMRALIGVDELADHLGAHRRLAPKAFRLVDGGEPCFGHPRRSDHPQ